MGFFSDKQGKMLDALARGVLIGGSVGVLYGLYALDMRKGLALGLIAGFAAALTKLAVENRKKK